MEPPSVPARRSHPLDYSNPKIPEGINTSKEHPLKDFFWLVGSVLALVLALLVTLSLSAEYLAKQIPFTKELEWAADFHPPAGQTDTARARTRYLNELAARLLQAHPLPEGMQVRIHYQDSDVINAYATLGGNIVVFAGLLEYLPSENALAMVLAHEIAHIRERHPIASLGRSASVSLALAVLGGLTGNSSLDVFSQAGLLTMLKFSRSQESQADGLALEMVHDLYGHVAHSDSFFQSMLEEEDSSWVPEFLQTHPVHAGRVVALHQLAASRGWSLEGEPVALPLME